MNTAAKLTAFALGLAAVFGLAFEAGEPTAGERNTAAEPKEER